MKMMNRASLWLCVAVLCAVPVIAALAADDAKNQKGEITEWVWGDYEQKGASEFNNYYPNIKVNYVVIPSSNYTQKLQTTAASGGDMPDVANLEMTPRGMLVNLDIWERLDAAPYNMNKGDLVPWALPLISNEKGEVVSVQIDNCVGGYTYNRALAKKYFGTDDPAALEKIFTSWDVYIQKGKEIHDKSNGKNYLFGGVDDAFMAIFGLYTKDALVTPDKKLNLDSSYLPSYKIIEKLVKDKSVGKYNEWTPAWNSSFSSDTVAFFPGPSWFLTWAIKANDKKSTGKYGLITPPTGGYSWGGTAYAIPKASKNKLQAWTYIKWFTMSLEGSKCFMKNEATPTLYKPAYATDLYSTDANKDPYFGGQNVMQKLIEIGQNPNTKARPMTKYDNAISDTNSMILQDLGKGMSADAAFEKLKTEILKKLPELSK
jgi:multiple sugar transport system substrate-binding protein